MKKTGVKKYIKKELINIEKRGNNKDTFVINLFGGPGSGKSTMRARIFSELKYLGVNCEEGARKTRF